MEPHQNWQTTISPTAQKWPTVLLQGGKECGTRLSGTNMLCFPPWEGCEAKKKAFPSFVCSLPFDLLNKTTDLFKDCSQASSVLHFTAEVIISLLSFGFWLTCCFTSFCFSSKSQVVHPMNLEGSLVVAAQSTNQLLNQANRCAVSHHLNVIDDSCMADQGAMTVSNHRWHRSVRWSGHSSSNCHNQQAWHKN